MNSFTDPPNPIDTIKKITELKTPAEIQDYIEKIFPGWIICSLDKYCIDYPHLQNNWVEICRSSGVQPTKIILVADIKFDDEHKVTRAFCEFLTKNGYVVRRSGEFIPCSKCLSAIPCQDIWHLLKENNLPVPNEWQSTCSKC